ncbi:DUF4123 domain-containing protein [Motilimonas pumila]|uniref:DUF4123 domain-containing protein n=1 Tax=Motilimonas pumila TaxID=2303987 RepID=A0A418Y9E0_9GAMM|nr:DUF4123 domain-containing protein [Motilimonas pumila]RJG37102.1 DUF4123 domain-containing protein [Motilimonas pumila]
MSGSQKEQIIRQIDNINSTHMEQVINEASAAPFAYAIIEQNLYPNFMAQLYGLDSANLTWDYLFRPDRDEGLRLVGPVLIALNDDDLSQWLKQLLTQQSGGCLLRSTTDFDETLLWAQARMTLISPEGAQAICRFFDPKNMAFMLASQTASQQQAFWHQTHELYWFDAGQWWSYQSTPLPQPLIESYQLSQTELDGIVNFKEQVLKRILLALYQKDLQAAGISDINNIDTHFELAKSYGAKKLSDFSAWLELINRFGLSFYLKKNIEERLNHPNYPFLKKLKVVERELSNA